MCVLLPVWCYFAFLMSSLPFILELEWWYIIDNVGIVCRDNVGNVDRSQTLIVESTEAGEQSA